MAIKWISHCSADALIFLRNVLLRLRREQVDAGCEMQSRKTDARFYTQSVLQPGPKNLHRAKAASLWKRSSRLYVR